MNPIYMGDYIVRRGQPTEKYYENVKKINEDIKFCKVMIVDECEKLEEIIKSIPKEFYDKYTIVRSAPFFLEFLNKKVNKGTGVELLAKHLNIKQEEIMTFGDAGNDLDMIVYAGMGVAMENAFEEVKKAANLIAVPQAKLRFHFCV